MPKPALCANAFGDRFIKMIWVMIETTKAKAKKRAKIITSVVSIFLQNFFIFLLLLPLQT